MKYQGSCHCGQVAFEAEGEIAGVLSCNCSMCQRKGSLLWFIPRDALSLRAAPEAMGTYTFNKHKIQHHFCRACGIHPFGEAVGPDGRQMAAVNVRCIEGIDLESLPVQHYNGRDI